MDRVAMASAWQRCGIEAGDMVLLHSNITRTLRNARRVDRQATVGTVLDSFLDALSPTGTLLLPLFNFDYCNGTPFDIRTSPSRMGVLSETARTHPLAVRTGHPVYSFAVIGQRASEFEGLDNRSAYGEDSPFGMLRRAQGKIAVLDLEDQGSMTFYHHVEEMRRVPYRYFKDFAGSYTGWSGHAEQRTYRIYVRDLALGVRTHVKPTGELMWRRGLYQGCRPGQDIGLRVVTASSMFDCVAELIDGGKARGMLYQLAGDET